MSRTAERAIFLGLGALAMPLGQLLAARLSHRHFLDIKD